MSGTELLEFHRKLTLANFVIGEDLEIKAPLIYTSQEFNSTRTNLEMRSQPKLGHYPDTPLGRVVLVPLDCIPVIHRELECVLAIVEYNKNMELT